jgi:drug/metabolite transporter (DMT)-like permease
VALAAVSSSAPLIAYAAAPALVVAFWRNALASLVLAPVAVLRRRDELRHLAADPDGRRTARYGVLAGVALAAHFACWMPSAKLTSVAAATALVATQPVWQGLIALGQGRRPPAVVWVGVAVAVTGAAAATGVDLGDTTGALLGDLLAVAGAMAAAVYTALGERVRSAVSTTTYTSVCYPVAALLLVVVCLVGGLPLTGFDTPTWLAVFGLVAGAQLLGHTLFNYALHTLPATTVSVLILLEAPGAAVIAWLWLGQLPRPAALPGLALLLVGVAVVVLGGARAARRAAPVPAPPDAGPLPD